ncbi:hypothetical protein ZWY2020_047873 [Hordeum vulgare]|nr:hypothetical protein ZWY2020_047873 [Hordeum vulgare]
MASTVAHFLTLCGGGPRGSFEQRNVGSGTGVLLLQTLHFADRDKTEDAITELLVGLNYLWRYGTQLSAKPKLESVVAMFTMIELITWDEDMPITQSAYLYCQVSPELDDLRVFIK